MKNDYTSNSHYLTYTSFSLEGWENELFELGSERANVPLCILLCRLPAIPPLVSDVFHISVFLSSFCAPYPDQLSLLYRAGAENNRKSSTSTSHASCSSICCRWAKSSWTSTMSSSRTRQATPGLYHNRAARSPFFLQSCVGFEGRRRCISVRYMPTPRKYVFDVTSVVQRLSLWPCKVLKVKVEMKAHLYCQLCSPCPQFMLRQVHRSNLSV